MPRCSATTTAVKKVRLRDGSVPCGEPLPHRHVAHPRVVLWDAAPKGIMIDTHMSIDTAGERRAYDQRPRWHTRQLRNTPCAAPLRIFSLLDFFSTRSSSFFAKRSFRSSVDALCRVDKILSGV